MRNLYLIGYDIQDNTVRRRVLQTLKGNAIGGQKSLYECWLDADEFRDAHDRLHGLVQSGRDRVVLTRLDPRAAIHTLGIAVPPEDGTIFYQG